MTMCQNDVSGQSNIQAANPLFAGEENKWSNTG
jgi:hypothetical protein